MRNTIYRYFFKEFISLFLLILISIGAIVWVVQAVNYLDFVTDDGHSFSVYFTFSILNIPKVLNRLIPFVFLISLLVTILQFEKNNELFFLDNLYNYENILFISGHYTQGIMLSLGTGEIVKNYINKSDINLFKSFSKN